jgi:polysaccharide export outer membrane protein
MNSRPISFALFAWLLAIALPLAAATSTRESAVKPPEPDREALKENYILQPRDVLRVQVFQEDDISKQCDALSVSQDYNVILPLIGIVDLRGKTVQQAGKIIRDRYDRDYLVDPQVTVTVVKYADRYVKMFGQVTKAGSVPFPPEEGLTFSEAVSLAGGFTRLADLKRVTIARTTPEGDTKVIPVNAADLIKGAAGEDVPLLPNDIINVPERIL